MKINWKPVKEFAELLGMVVVYGLVVDASSKMAERMYSGQSSVTVGYDKAISAIMKSDMYSHDKADAAAALKRIGSNDFYRAIVHIAEDNSVYSHDKVNMIKALSEN